ncbi:MAG: SU10 major capsid protein [Planctomycetota bacterium]
MPADLTMVAQAYNTDTSSAYGFTANTNVRDVSSMLELWAHDQTPLLNRISWGEPSGGLVIEWLHEHLGFGYVTPSAAIACNGTALVCATGTSPISAAEQGKQLHRGTILVAQGAADSGASESGDIGWLIVTTVTGDIGSATVAWVSSCTGSVAAATKLYIVGSFVNEGSTPERDVTRKRTLLSNKMTILRRDIRITGSMAQTDMHAVANELNHQTRLRLLEMQFERERSVLLSRGAARTADATAETIGLMNGMLELMRQNRSSAFVDTSTTTLAEDTFNDVYAECVDSGGNPDVVVGAIKHIRKFTAWDKDRVRTRVDQRLGGKYIADYLTDTGEVVTLVGLKKFSPSWLFVIDTSKVKLRAKKGRKLLLSKLGLAGDYMEYQLISEYSMEHHGITDGHHAAFLALT